MGFYSEVEMPLRARVGIEWRAKKKRPSEASELLQRGAQEKKKVAGPRYGQPAGGRALGGGWGRPVGERELDGGWAVARHAGCQQMRNWLWLRYMDG